MMMHYWTTCQVPNCTVVASIPILLYSLEIDAAVHNVLEAEDEEGKQ